MSVPEIRQQNNEVSEHGRTANEFAPGVSYTTIVFVNAYFVDARDGGNSWVLVDTGLPNMAALVRRAVEARYGSGARPRAIILTHGHFDHAGNALDLAREWDVPVYAHRLEMPYLTGKSDYPPQDPTVGGALAFLSRFFSATAVTTSATACGIAGGRSVPGLPECARCTRRAHRGHSRCSAKATACCSRGTPWRLSIESALTIATQQREFARRPRRSPPTGRRRANRLSCSRGWNPRRSPPATASR